MCDDVMQLNSDLALRKVKLSICIPTYNRANFIEETIQSILSQATSEIEIVVSDNCSEDNTENIIRRIQKESNQITYFRWNENQGADLNYLKVVELAKGQYCWLLGSDDLLLPGSIDKILKEINFGYDIYLCNRIDCTYELRKVKKSDWLISTPTHIFDFSQSKTVSYTHLTLPTKRIV